MTDWQSRQTQFEVIVLQTLWLIVRLLIYTRRATGGPGSRHDFNSANVRTHMLLYMDEHGRPGKEEYRREYGFPEIGREP